MALSSSQHLAALQYPWYAKRAYRPSRMIRISPPCATHPITVNRQPITRTEDLRRQIVGLVEARQGDLKFVEVKKSDFLPGNSSARKQMSELLHSSGDDAALRSLRNTHNKGTRLYPPTGITGNGDPMPSIDPHVTLQEALKRSKTNLNGDNKMRPKIVRFKMEDFVDKQKQVGAAVHSQIRERSTPEPGNSESHQDYEVRGSAISLRREGLKGLLAYKDLCTENEKRQNSIQTSLKIYRRRVKLNQDKFIQPNETPTDEYVIHQFSSFRDVISPIQADDTSRQSSRPKSSYEHVRMLRSALQCKRSGAPTIKQTDNVDSSEAAQQQAIRCSYKLPENSNWSKEVSFKDIKDDSIPNVKTYVLEEEASSSKKRQQSIIESSVILTSHNLGVHNSMTNTTIRKLKFGESDVSFDPRFVDWLEDSYTNLKTHNFFPTDDIESPPVNVNLTKRRLSGRS